MKLWTIMIVAVISFVAVSGDGIPHAVAQSSDSNSNLLNGGQTVIEAGSRVGPLKLGDSEERALALFPKKYEDQQWDDKCGTTYTWADTENTVRGGTLAIRVKKGIVFQIESATTRFRTAEGIAALDPPEKVEHDYKELSAYTLLSPPSAALGSRPLVYWVDKKKGIAFALAYYPSQHKRYLYKIIVFVPNKTFCPEQETTGSSKWQSITPYSLEPPAALSPESN